jgi:hypothetical protein
MKSKILAVVAFALIVVAPAVGHAQWSNLFNNGSQSANPFIYLGQKTSITNFKVGTCKKLDNGYWMQLADGTWADPNSALNLCGTNGRATNWLNSSLYNSWLRSGIGQNGSTYSTTGLLQNNGYTTSNYGQFSSYQDWYTNCVLMESIYPRPECQATPYQGYYTSPWDLAYGANLFARITIGDSGTITLAGTTGSKDLGGIIGGALLYGLLSDMFQ